MRGHPVRGAIAGLFFGLFLGLELMMFKVLTLGRTSTVFLPLLFMVLGIVIGLWAPLGRRRTAAAPLPPPPAPPPPAAPPADGG
ncbi:MAG TPA: hypothetical protein VGB83_00175 [Actinomycetota bacterium]